MPLGFVRAGLLAWGHRRGLGRLLVCWCAAAMVLPLVLGLLVVAALAGGPGAAVPAPGGVVGPLAAWVVSQPYGCTGLAFEPPRGSCAHFHYGIDLVSPAGAPVSAVTAGQAEVFLPGGTGGGTGSTLSSITAAVSKRSTPTSRTSRSPAATRSTPAPCWGTRGPRG